MKRVLIVEDYYVLADVESLLCTMEGYEVRVARNGKEGLVAAAEFKPDLVLLDLVLPGPMDGLEMLRRLHAEGDAKVLVISARLDESTRADIEAAGGAATLPKPFRVNELAARIQELLAP